MRLLSSVLSAAVLMVAPLSNAQTRGDAPRAKTAVPDRRGTEQQPLIVRTVPDAMVSDTRGTEQQPLVVRTVPENESEPVKTAREHSARVAESVGRSLEHIKVDSFRTVALTGLLALLGTGQLALFWWQLRLIKRSVEDAGAAASAAEKSADVAEKTVQTMKETAERQLRAYVFVESIPFNSHLNPDTGNIWWSIQPVWKNAGSTPTRSLFINVNADLRDTPLPADFAYPDSPASPIPMLIGPQSSIQAGMLRVEGDALSEVKSGHKRLYIWGWAKYRDVFVGTPERMTKFCVEVSHVLGNPTKAYDAKTNIVELPFHFYGVNNCLDDACPG